MITKWNEISPQRWDEWYPDDGVYGEEDLDEYQKPYEPITVEDVDLCIEVRHGCIVFPKPEDGLRKLAEYNALYTEEERRQFPRSYFYQNTFTMPFDEDYFVRFLTFYGDIPGSVMEYYLEKVRKFEKECRERGLL